MYVSSRPGLSSSMLSGNPKPFHGPLFNFKRVTFYPYARNALYEAARLMGISSSDAVLFPDFLCNTAVKPFLKFTEKTRFYKIGKDLSIDFEDLEKKLENDVKVVVMIHYFGFPAGIERISDICRERNIYLVEDCAQCLFSEHKGLLGSFGDFSAFSMHKSLPVPECAALVVNNDDFEPPENEKELENSECKRLIERKVEGLKDIWTHTRSGGSVPFDAWKNIKESERQLHSDPAFFYKVPDISRVILGNMDMKEVKMRRSRNFKFFLNNLENDKIAPVFKELPKGICPLGFPVLIDKRESVKGMLLQSGIETFIHWNMLIPPEAKKRHEIDYLARHILTLPVHHGLDKKHMEYLAEKINSIV